MARPRLRSAAGAAASLLPFIFSLLAFTFSILAVTSPDWAIRDQYAENTDAVSQITPIFTLRRSPYQICTAELIETASDDDNDNNDDDDEGGDDQPPPPPPTAEDFKSVCQHFRISGFNATSCELPSTLGTNLAPQVGDARQCQQIHLATRYHVASAVFLGVTLILSIVAVGLSFASSSHGAVVSQVVSVSALVGAGAGLIAQYYGILGLVQSAPNNADFATSQGNREHHDPWVQGQALGLYLGFSWFWALLAAWTTWLVWGAAAGWSPATGKSKVYRDHGEDHDGVREG